jgi:hypothetical protein
MKQSQHARSIFQLQASNTTRLVGQPDGEGRNGKQVMEEITITKKFLLYHTALTHDDNANLSV